MSRNGSGHDEHGDVPLGTDALFGRLHEIAAARSGRSALTLDQWTDFVTAFRIAQALRECRGNRSAAARALGIGRRTLYSKIQRLGLEPAWELPPRSR